MSTANTISLGSLSWNMANKDIEQADIDKLIDDNQLKSLDGIVIGGQEEARSGEPGELRCSLAHKIADTLGSDYDVVTQSGYYTQTKLGAAGEGQVSLAVVMRKRADAIVESTSDKYQEADGFFSAKNKGGTTQQITVGSARFKFASAHLASYTDSRKITELNEVLAKMYQQRRDESVTYDQLEKMSSDQDVVLMDANYRNMIGSDGTIKSPYGRGGPAAHIDLQGFQLAQWQKGDHTYYKNSEHNDDKDSKRKVGQSDVHYTRGGLLDHVAFQSGQAVALNVINGMETPGMDHKPVFAKFEVEVSPTEFLRTRKWVLQSLQSLSSAQPDDRKIAQDILDKVGKATESDKDFITEVYNYYCVGVRAIQVRAELYKAQGKHDFANALNDNEGMAKLLIQAGNIHFSAEGSVGFEHQVNVAVEHAYKREPALRNELSIFKIIANVFLKLVNRETYKCELEKKSSLLTGPATLFSTRCSRDSLLAQDESDKKIAVCA